MTKQQFMDIVKSPTMRLGIIHLAIIMLLSISFSVVFYHTSDRQFARPMPQFGQSVVRYEGDYLDRFDEEIRIAIDDRFDQTRQELLMRLVWINIGALLLGAGISYLLARWSLRPIEEAMAAQTQFVSDASHELRTPLTVLQTTNEVALRKSKLPNAEARELIAHNIEEVKKLRDLSNTLLDLLKNPSASAALTRVNLQDAISDALPPIVGIAQEKNISIEDTVPDLKVHTDQAAITRIVSILLDNAIKYSPEGTKVILSAKRSGKKVLLNIADEGIGIRSSDIPLIFNRFYRADMSRSSLESSSHGYGLGLAIANKLATRLGVKLSVKSTVGKGSTFTVEVPTSQG